MFDSRKTTNNSDFQYEALKLYYQSENIKVLKKETEL